MNLFLLTKWYSIMDEAYCNFVDLFMTSFTSYPEPEEILQFRSCSGLFPNPLASTPQRPVVFIVCRNEHYFTVCFDYGSNHAWVIGQHIHPQTPAALHDNVTWDGWDGLMYWWRIAALFGWPVSQLSPKVTSYDFQQVCSSHHS